MTTASTTSPSTTSETGGMSVDPAVAVVPEIPQLVPSVELRGAMDGSAFDDQPWLVQRGDKFIQLSELLYRIASQADGTHTIAEIAAAVTDSTDWLVTPDNVRQLVGRKLIPLGIIAAGGDAGPVRAGAAAPSVVSLNLRTRVFGPEFIEPLARPMQHLFTPVIMLLTLLNVVLAQAWLFRQHALQSSLVAILTQPVLMLGVIGLLVVAGVFHEYGHAAGLRKGGANARGMGVGLFVIYPAFFTDTSECYRLGRWARVRTDLGGFYFHLIFTIALVTLYHFTGWVILPIAVVMIDLDIARQLIPFARLDGYWAMSDLIGVPDLFTVTKPFLKSLLPRRYRPKGVPARVLKPWAETLFAGYLALTIPVLAILGFLFVTQTPGMVHVMIHGMWLQSHDASEALRLRNYATMALAVFQLLLLQLELAGIAYLFYIQGRSLYRGLRRWGQPTRARRAGSVLAGLAILTTLFYFWVP